MKIPLIAIAAVLLVVSGCGASTPPAPPDVATPLISPQEMTAIQQGLYSPQPRQQFAALNALTRFPPLVKNHQQRIEALAASPEPQVRERAQQLLATVSPPAPVAADN